MIFGINNTSASSLGTEAKAAMYYDGSQHADNEGQPDPIFDISNLYPKAYHRAAGATSRGLFQNAPEAGRRHLFSENLKNHPVGKKGHGYDAGPKIKVGAAGLTSDKLYNGHKLNALGDEKTAKDMAKDYNALSNYLRDEEADIVIYGGDRPDEEYDLIASIPDRNPKAFEDAAGLTSAAIFRVHGAATMDPEHHPEEHMLGQARFGGEGEETIYGRRDADSVEYEVQKLAPKAYNGAAGMTSKDIFLKKLGGADDLRDQQHVGVVAGYRGEGGHVLRRLAARRQ
mmetsp:Transcript_34114/g.100246  ORF Transcript_34114/g.100246 Transcript_34114/m.100246 type:complete len:285 (-) Transcript_34114:652-1506(-)